MTQGKAKPVRCAIYTRVSTDQGLEQDFNSLDAQYDACQAYIRSQVHAGWTLVRGKYDDGGFSGGSTDRPALQQLLEDIRAGKVNIIVVYKVDRLTRSLADFAKLVELFDQHGVSFVSVTQQFNTTTSMGRLTLNVLLSFAQFEREVTSERIRDKIAASKRKGLWVGGMVPLGYDTKERKITVNEAEAECVRMIFRSYLKLGSLNRLMVELRKRGIVTKRRTLRSGRTMGGDALLIGKIFDDHGNRMSPSHARKAGVRYRYYVSLPLLQARPREAGSVHRVPATEIETLVATTVRRERKIDTAVQDRDLLKKHIVRVTVQRDALIIEAVNSDADHATEGAADPKIIRVSWQKVPSRRRREIIAPPSLVAKDPRPIRADARAKLIAAIARGRRWLDTLVTGKAISVEEIATRDRCSVRRVNMTISLAFLAPDLVKAAIEGRLPRSIGMARLCDLPAEWSAQYQELGLTLP